MVAQHHWRLCKWLTSAILLYYSYFDALIVYSDAKFCSRKRLRTYQYGILHICGPWFMVKHRWLILYLIITLFYSKYLVLEPDYIF
jgi:hypothetical protein